MSDPASPSSPASARVNRAPRASYRLQLRPDFGFSEVKALLDRLERLGLSELYLSPLFRAREESSHGYDVVDHARLEPSFGDLAELNATADEARRRSMGILLDIVPNHMGINDPGNTAWNDVLENGSVSRYSRYFDIHWRAAPQESHVKVLLPFLGDRFGEVLERGELRLRYDQGRLQIAYHDRRFPVAPASWVPVLKLALQREPLAGDALYEFESIVTQLEHLPPYADHSEQASRQRYREQAVARRRLMRLLKDSQRAAEALQQAVELYNGTAGDPKSFDRLEHLLDAQHYRLAYWRVAADEINYRRFFDINDLVAIRVEDPEVFEAVHRLTFRLLKEGVVTGLRVDHPDGLLDPLEYFTHLQSSFRRIDADRHGDRSLYIVAEKILSGDESLPSEWPVSGTTGYDFIYGLTRLLVDAAGVKRLRELYPQLSGVASSPRDVVYQSKQTILTDVMSSELSVLASQLYRLAKQDRSSRDFTRPMLLRALREVIACFPVYRTYIRPQGWEVSSEDEGRVSTAVRWAKRRNPTMPWPVFDYLKAVLLMQFPGHLDESLQAKWREFTLRFQQVTGPVAAKGYEDTAFYRYYPLASLNEVGGEFDAEGISIEEFHRQMGRRGELWPLSLSATTTHDTKRGEDVRARLDVLSEMPDEWASCVTSWNEQFASLLQELDDRLVPSRNERYLLYQTLIGTWPLSESDESQQRDYYSRIANYLEKSLREAKLRSSWLNPSLSYEGAVKDFLTALLLDPQQSENCAGLDRLVRRIAGAGFVNSLSQVVLKCTLPGVPDFYQGCEFWDFRLVDPDNRQAVDHGAVETELQGLEQQWAESPSQLREELRQAWHDRLKLYVTWRALGLRKRFEPVFSSGTYLPLVVQGPLADHIVAFARQAGEHVVGVIVPRGVFLLTKVDNNEIVPPSGFCGELWRGNRVKLPDPPPRWQCELNGTTVGGESVDVADLFRDIPMAILSPIIHQPDGE